MQPSAGPWLSPKLVTVKILPKVLPATPLPLLLRKIRAPAAEIRRRRPSRSRGQTNGRRGKARSSAVSVLPTSTTRMPSSAQMRARRAEDRPHRIESVDARGQAEPRLVAVFARQRAHLRAPDVGRIADDDIVTAARDARRNDPIAAPGRAPPSPSRRTLRRHTASASVGDVDRIDARARKGPRARERDRAGAGADVENAAHAARARPRARSARIAARRSASAAPARARPRRARGRRKMPGASDRRAARARRCARAAAHRCAPRRARPSGRP